MSRAGWVGIALALGIDGLLAAALARPRAVPVVHPVAPPLTRIAALGDHPIGGEGPTPGMGWRLALEQTVQATGTPAQRAEAVAIRPAPPPPGTGRALLQADAVAIAGVLGPARVARILAEKEHLGDTTGEGQVWDEIAR